MFSQSSYLLGRRDFLCIICVYQPEATMELDAVIYVLFLLIMRVGSSKVPDPIAYCGLITLRNNIFFFFFRIFLLNNERKLPRENLRTYKKFHQNGLNFNHVNIFVHNVEHDRKML